MAPESKVSECAYLPLEQRAAALVAKGTRGWQDLQRVVIAEELAESLLLRGQELWLPHHETDPAQFHVTLRVTAYLPPGDRSAAERLQQRIAALEADSLDEAGHLRIDVSLG